MCMRINQLVEEATTQCKQLNEDDEQERDWIASCARNDGDDGREVGRLSCLHWATTIDNLFIRKATIDDAEVLQRLYHKYLGNHNAYELRNIIGSFESVNIIVVVINDERIIGALTYAKVFNSGEMDFNIAKDGGIIIGSINAISIGDERVFFDDDIKYELRDLCVDEAYRYRGVATVLLEYALSEMQDPAYALVWAQGGEARAQQLWKSHGFKLQEKIKNLGELLPEFCAKCVERNNGCNYCEVHVYVEKSGIYGRNA